ncbi:uncharacterized protein BDR25DRAFT_23788 [Lindgomyces ingoldianus]|uniref:Uncharacterized protein n=1 Tax=Lindgomyces ingoldianus TaxID=673940 RepID=A0ACB6QYB7_9PLEO|nr:uncharacterized protein BDR25DRAFT_23788 [Lindgomyces ingoldianus]KAF2471855.1 hypothetical protein BDR25DRAFT_23788 [Lindgomyces ingoldianus]
MGRKRRMKRDVRGGQEADCCKVLFLLATSSGLGAVVVMISFKGNQIPVLWMDGRT